MSLEQGILGFLSMKPMSGYDIKKLFDMSASYFWPANQAQIYRTLKELVGEGLVELSECAKGRTVDRKVYAITDRGREAFLETASKNCVADFISHDLFLLQLFYSGALPAHEQSLFIDRQLENVRSLERRLLENYNKNYAKFLNTTGIDESDPRLQSALFTHRWGLIKCREYARLLEEIKAEIDQRVK